MTTIKRLGWLVTKIVGFQLLIGCESAGFNVADVSDTDTDADTDSDSDGDTDIDTDTDADTDTDTDTDIDTDTDSDVDSDSDSDSDTLHPDMDSDGWISGIDCDDKNPDINQGEEEIYDPPNGVDEDCDGLTDEEPPVDTSTEIQMCDVDLLFVIDVSNSMGPYQAGLGLAFPRFADSLIKALPSTTNVHVGVTSTEMGYSPFGMTWHYDWGCVFQGTSPKFDEYHFYVTPDVNHTGTNGAQGRLYQPPGKPPFFDFDIGAGPAELQDLRQWFVAASGMGTNGSQFEMLTAPAGWSVHEANATENAGFFRDSGTLLVLFFIQDEPDHTPLDLDGMNGGEAMLQRLVDAKPECGGLDCIVAGGFTDIDMCGKEPRPIKYFLEGLTQGYVVAPIPSDKLTAEQIADEMADMLTTQLSSLIFDACEDIPPPV